MREDHGDSVEQSWQMAPHYSTGETRLTLKREDALFYFEVLVIKDLDTERNDITTRPLFDLEST